MWISQVNGRGQHCATAAQLKTKKALPALSRCFSAGGPLCCVLALNPAVGGSEDVLGWVFQRAPQAADVGCGRWPVLGAGGNHRPARGADRAATENAGCHLETRSKVIQNRCVRSWFNHTRCDCAVLTRRGEDGDTEGVGEEQDRAEISRVCWGGHQQKAIKLQAETVCCTQTPLLKNRGKGRVQGCQTYGPGTQKWHAKESNPAGLCSSGWDHYSIVLQYCVWKYNPTKYSIPWINTGFMVQDVENLRIRNHVFILLFSSI